MPSSHPNEFSPLFRAQPSSPRPSPERKRRPPLRLIFLIVAIFVLFFFIPSAPVYRTHPQLQPLSPTSNRTAIARLLTLNTFIRPVLIGINDYKDERLADLEDVLRQYDLVCLQELFWTTGQRKSRFLKRIAPRLPYQASSPTLGLRGLLQLPPKVIDAGLVIASRYPIVRAHYHTFSHAVRQSIDLIVAKGVLYARVAIFPQRYVHVFTAHLQAGNGLRDEPFKKVRQQQLQELAEFVKVMVKDDPEGVIVIAGDLNVDGRNGREDSSSSREYKQAATILHSIRESTPLRDLLYEAENFSHPVTTAGGLDGRTQKNERLDYLFVSSHDEIERDIGLVAQPVPGSVHTAELRRERDGYNTVSDHYGVRADVRFERA